MLSRTGRPRWLDQPSYPFESLSSFALNVAGGSQNRVTEALRGCVSRGGVLRAIGYEISTSGAHLGVELVFRVEIAVGRPAAWLDATVWSLRCRRGRCAADSRLGRGRVRCPSVGSGSTSMRGGRREGRPADLWLAMKRASMPASWKCPPAQHPRRTTRASTNIGAAYLQSQPCLPWNRNETGTQSRRHKTVRICCG